MPYTTHRSFGDRGIYVPLGLKLGSLKHYLNDHAAYIIERDKARSRKWFLGNKCQVIQFLDELEKELLGFLKKVSKA